jgi:dsDNA-specific endonuclease/ATPase MutS2
MTDKNESTIKELELEADKWKLLDKTTELSQLTSAQATTIADLGKQMEKLSGMLRTQAIEDVVREIKACDKVMTDERQKAYQECAKICRAVWKSNPDTTEQNKLSHGCIACSDAILEMLNKF